MDNERTRLVARSDTDRAASCDPALLSDLMAEMAATTFEPPTPEQVEAYLGEHQAVGPSRMVLFAPLAVFIVAWALAEWMGPQGYWLLLAAASGLVVWALMRAGRARKTEQAATTVRDLAMRRDWHHSLREAWHALPQLIHNPALHGQTVMIMAINLDHMRAYSSAIVAYDYLVERLPDQHPAATLLRVQRTIAQLADDRLADADDALRRLRGVADQTNDPAVVASYHFALLLQQVRTHHYLDAIAESAKVVDTLRPLGIEAAYGYGLMALSYQQLARRAEDHGETYRASAAQWWARATLLMPVDKLVARHAELADLAARWPASSCVPPLPGAASASPPRDTAAPVEHTPPATDADPLSKADE